MKRRVIRCELCFRVFPDMKAYTKHHEKAHKKQLSAFEQLIVGIKQDGKIGSVRYERETA